VSLRTLVLLAALTGACDGVLPRPDLERMLVQPSYRPYGASSRFADGRAMREPPAGAVPHDQLLGQPALTEGIEQAAYVTRIPLAVDRALLARGRDRFETFCGVCHGLTGDGRSEVARRMVLRAPPSLVAAPVTEFPPGRVYQVISLGYGLMPGYSAELAVRDRWAVVGYLEALQLAAGARLASLPPAIQAEAGPWLARGP
jgi:mono/diheme cytochrome c family protein